jgi:hypothetical protein
VIRCLLADDAQAFIDVIDEALDRPDLSAWTRSKCLKSLYRTCGRHALLPRTLKIPDCGDRTGVALFRGGFADVWKGEHRGRHVAVKVIRTYSNSDLQKIIGVSCRCTIPPRACTLTIPCVEVLQGGCDVEIPPASERPVTDRSDDVRGSVRNDIGLDGKWEHQRLCEGTPGCKPIGPGRLSIQKLAVSTPSSLIIG